MKIEDLYQLAEQHKLPDEMVRSWMSRTGSNQNPVIDAQMVLDYRAYIKRGSTWIMVVAVAMVLIGCAILFFSKHNNLAMITLAIGGLIYGLGNPILEAKRLYRGIEQRQRNAELFIADYMVLCKLVGRLSTFELIIRSAEDLRRIADKELTDQAAQYLQYEQMYEGLPIPFVKDERVSEVIQEFQSTYYVLFNLGLASINLEFYFDTARQRLAA